MRRRAFTLVELLVAIALIALLAAILLPAVARAYRHCRAWAWGVEDFHNRRIEAFLFDASEKWQLHMATNRPKPWTGNLSPSQASGEHAPTNAALTISSP